MIDLKANIKKYIPSTKFMTASMALFPVYWAINVFAFDILDLPVWSWYIVIAIIMFTVRYNIYKFWVYRKNNDEVVKE